MEILVHKSAKKRLDVHEFLDVHEIKSFRSHY